MQSDPSDTPLPIEEPHPPFPVLVVDDDEGIRNLLTDVLNPHEFAVHTAADTGKARELLRQHRFATILCDQYLPEEDGLSFLRQCRERQPMAPRILMTGYPSAEVAIKAINTGQLYRFLAKPWSEEELLSTLHNATAHYRVLLRNQRLEQLTSQLNVQLAQANKSLSTNFNHSIELCHRIMATFSPLLGKSTRAVEQICGEFSQLDLLSPDEKQILRVAASLHNIGLLGVPRDILALSFHNPKLLNDQQRALVRSHPVYGESLAAFVGNLAGVGETIRAHHEQWDGSGYPDGLREEAIPMPARFLAVACAFVESGYSREDTIRIIKEHSNSRFYPEAVRAFLSISQKQNLPRRIREVTLKDLRPGMTLARSLHSPAGLLLIPEGQTISRDVLRRIHDHDILAHIKDRLLVYV